MIFTATEGEHEIKVYLSDDNVRLTTDYLPGEGFGSLEKLRDAIAKKELKARKEFTNRTAYMTEGWGDRSLQEVQVTSVDHDGKRAWVKKLRGGRTLESIDRLFVDGEAVRKVLANDTARDEQSKAEWAALERWTPKP